MARGPHLKAIQDKLNEIFRKYPELRSRPTEFRKQLLEEYGEELEKNYGPDFPSRVAISKWLKEYRRKYEERPPELKELDKPWSFGSLVNNPIPPEAIPLVALIHDKCLSEDSEEWVLTIREALWIGRLHKIIEICKSEHLQQQVIEELHKGYSTARKIPLIEGREPTEKDLALAWGIKGKEILLEDIVLDWAYIYSTFESMSEIDNELFDTRDLDTDLMRNVYEAHEERRSDFIMRIARKYGVDVDKLIYPELSVGQIKHIAISTAIESRKGVKFDEKEFRDQLYKKYIKPYEKTKEARNERLNSSKGEE
jgi:hypothetical protein